jgi:hypothetical protein
VSERQGVNDILEAEPSKNILDASMLRFESNDVIYSMKITSRGQL